MVKTATRVTALTFLTPVFGVAYSWFLLNEMLTPMQLLGVLGVCLGVYIVNSGGALEGKEKRRKRERGKFLEVSSSGRKEAV